MQRALEIEHYLHEQVRVDRGSTTLPLFLLLLLLLTITITSSLVYADAVDFWHGYFSAQIDRIQDNAYNATSGCHTVHNTINNFTDCRLGYYDGYHGIKPVVPSLCIGVSPSAPACSAIGNSTSTNTSVLP